MLGSSQGGSKGGGPDQSLKNQVERVKPGTKCTRYTLENALEIKLNDNTFTFSHFQCWKGDINLVCNDKQEKCECRHRTSWVDG